MTPVMNAFVGIFSVFFLGFLPFIYIYEVLSRKVVADLQARVGPKESGWGGFFQPFYDFLRLLRKEPVEVSWHHTLAYLVMAVSAWALLASVPISPVWGSFDTDASFLLPLCAGACVCASVFWLALSRGDHGAITTLLRWQSVMGAAVVTLLICIASVSLEIGEFRWARILEVQQGGLLNWIIFKRPPVFLVIFGCYFVSGLTFFDLEPMRSLSEPGSRGQSGLGTVFTGRYSLLFGFTRRVFLFAWVCIGVCLFFGGWLPPAFDQAFSVSTTEATASILVGQLFILFAKAIILLLALAWFSSTLSKLRAEQVGELQWKVFTPLALFSFAGLALWIFLGLGGA